MATNYLAGTDGAALPEGIVLQHTLYGEPDRTVTHAYTASGAAGVELVPSNDGVEYGYEPVVGPVPEPVPEPVVELVVEPVPEPVPVGRDETRAKRCMAKDDTCMGWKINDSDFCAAHAGKWHR